MGTLFIGEALFAEDRAACYFSLLVSLVCRMIQYGQKGVIILLQEQLKALRLKKGLSQEELAARVHVVRQTVSKWETGSSVPDAQTLILIAQVLETPVSVLLGEQPNRDKEEEDELTQIAQKLERLNEELARKSAANRRRIRTVAISVLILAAVSLMVLLFLAAEPFLRQPFGSGIIGGADGPTDILVFSGTHWLGIGVSALLCVFVVTAAAVVLHRTKR